MDANMEDAAPNGQEQATEATDAQMAAAAAARGAGNGTIERNAPNGAQANLNDEPGLDGYERYVKHNRYDTFTFHQWSITYAHAQIRSHHSFHMHNKQDRGYWPGCVRRGLPR